MAPLQRTLQRSDAEACLCHTAMGTVMNHTAVGPGAEEALNAVRAEVMRLEGLFSRFSRQSDVDRINRSAGVRCVRVSPETCAVLSAAIGFSHLSAGRFDVTVAPLVDLWNIGGQRFSEPDPASIEGVLTLVDFRDLILDRAETAAGLNRRGQAVDLGGIGKGYAGDRIRAVFQAHGITSACSNLGGNVIAVGAKADGAPWCIGIQHPRVQGSLIGAVAVADRSVVTSGDYQRRSSGRRGITHHHILDPVHGYPSRSGLISVSVVAESSLAADALSTILFASGLESGLALLRLFPETEAIFIDNELQVTITRGLQHRFQADRNIQLEVRR